MQTPVEKIKPSPALDKDYYIRLSKMLILPFNRQEAYHLGLIDADGNEKRESKNSSDEAAYTPLHQLAFGLKKFILSKPGGTQLLKRTAVALNTLSKAKNRKLEPKDLSSLIESNKNSEQFILENDLTLAFEEAIIDSCVKKLEEEESAAAPTNTTAGVDGVDLPLGTIRKRKKVEEAT